MKSNYVGRVDTRTVADPNAGYFYGKKGVVVDKTATSVRLKFPCGALMWFPNSKVL